MSIFTKFAITLLTIICLCLSIGDTASATPDVCDSNGQGCVVSITNTTLAEFYESDGTSQGGVTFSSSNDGVCSSSKGEQYTVCTRGTDVAITHVPSNTTCWTSVQTSGGHATFLNGFTYVVDESAARVYEFDMNCTSSRYATTGVAPVGITNDGTYIYVAVGFDYNVAKIDPAPMMITETIDLGLTTWLDGVTSIGYHASTDALYVGKVDEILKVKWNVTQWDVTQFVLIPGMTPSGININNDQLLIRNSTTDVYLLDIINPTPFTTISYNNNGATLSDTHVYICGNGIRQYDLAGSFVGTVTSTNSQDCTFYFSNTVPPVCGDGSIDAGEQCDDSNTNDSDGCSSSCQVEAGYECIGEPSSCNLLCGNGAINAGEQCDGADLNNEDCADHGYMLGDLTCTASCTFDFAQCTPFEDCGNGTIENGEDCDGANLNSASCSSLGFDSGTLVCSGSCSFDTTQCSNAADCGDGDVEGTEECDDGTANSDTEPNACRTDCTLPTCGDNVIDAGEECDDANLDGKTCSDVGDFTNGSLTCSSCTFDTNQCTNEPCDPNNIVNILTEDIDDPGLQGALEELYRNNVTTMDDADAAKSCIENEHGSFIQITSSGFVNFEVTLPVVTDIAMYHAHKFEDKAPIVLINANAPDYFWPKAGGGFVIHDGDDPLNFGFGRDSTPVTVGYTEGTIPAWRFASSFVDKDGMTHFGRFIGFRLFESSIFMALYGDPNNSVVIPTHTAEQLELCEEQGGDACWSYLDENQPGDLSRLQLDDVIPPNPPKTRGCNQCNTGSTPPLGTLILLIFGFLFLRFWRRRQLQTKMQRVSLRRPRR